MIESIPGDGGPTLPPDMLDLVERVAAYPHGLGFLHLASLETIAVTLGTDPYLTDRARSMLMTSEGRATLIAEVRRAKSRGIASPADPAAGPPSEPGIATSVEELVERALSHPLGIRFLLDGPMEVVAITLQAHAFLVLEARDMLQARFGLQGHPEEDGEE